MREDGKRSRYPPEKNPHAELIPFVVEARGRLGSEVVSFLRQHAPEEEPLRSAVLARATREIPSSPSVAWRLCFSRRNRVPPWCEPPAAAGLDLWVEPCGARLRACDPPRV